MKNWEKNSLLLDQPGRWVGTWSAALQPAEPANLPPEPFFRKGQVFVNTTLRQTVRVSGGGKYLRVRFSNIFGTATLVIAKVSMALPANGIAGISGVQPGSVHQLMFRGCTAVEIPAGAEVYSDPVQFKLEPLSNLAITIYMAQGQPADGITSHPGSRTTSFLIEGDRIFDGELTGAVAVEHWYYLSGVEVWAGSDTAAVAIIGDSLTDGRGSTTNRNDRWPDRLADRLQRNPASSEVTVLNQGIGGNRVLQDGLGPNLLARLDRDVIAQRGVRWLIVFEGINDIGTAAATLETQNRVVADLITAYEKIVTRAHAQAIRVYGATLLPFCGSSYFDSSGCRETARQKLNHWIRTGGRFDGVIDFDRVVRDPDHPIRILTEADCGDHLHLNSAGYQMLGDAVPLDFFV